jgi:hypothetical protein
MLFEAWMPFGPGTDAVFTAGCEGCWSGKRVEGACVARRRRRAERERLVLLRRLRSASILTETKSAHGTDFSKKNSLSKTGYIEARAIENGDDRANRDSTDFKIRGRKPPHLPGIRTNIPIVYCEGQTISRNSQQNRVKSRGKKQSGCKGETRPVPGLS